MTPEVDARTEVDLFADFAGRLCRAVGQRLDLGRHDRETAARLARAGSFDRGVERKKIGLGGDIADETDDLADFLRVLGQSRDDRPGLAGFGHRLLGDFARMCDLAGNFLERGGEFFGAGGDRLDIARRSGSTPPQPRSPRARPEDTVSVMPPSCSST